MRHLDEPRVVTIHGRDVSVFRDGSVKVHGRCTKRKFGDKSYKGYLRMSLKGEDGHQHTVFIHRLVAMAFILNLDGKPQVNHKNGNKADNRVENLEWCTNLENRRHRSEVLGHYGRRTPVRCVETGEVFETTLDASKQKNVSRSNIQYCIKGKRKTAGGFHWERM